MQSLLCESQKYGGDDYVEIMVLQVMLHTSRLTIDPAAYGMKFSLVITRIYQNTSEEFQKTAGNPF